MNFGGPYVEQLTGGFGDVDVSCLQLQHLLSPALRLYDNGLPEAVIFSRSKNAALFHFRLFTTLACPQPNNSGESLRSAFSASCKYCCAKLSY